MTPANDLIEGGDALWNFSTGRCVFYKEDTDTIRMNLGRFPGRHKGVAVDAAGRLGEFSAGPFGPTDKVWTWNAPARSDWVLVVDDCFAGGRK